jgi:hypothetical protein
MERSGLACTNDKDPDPGDLKTYGFGTGMGYCLEVREIGTHSYLQR